MADYQALARQLIQLQLSLHQAPISRMLSDLERGTYLALNFLVLHGSSAYPKELSRGMSVSSARVAALLNHLEARGLIRRAPDPGDSRQTIVSLTEAGRQAIQRKRAEITDIVTQTLEELGPEDAEAFVRIHEKLVHNFLLRTRAGDNTGEEAPIPTP